MNQSFNSTQAINTAKNISQQAQIAKGSLTKVEREILAMESWWKGQSSAAFASEFQELKPSLNKMVALVENISRQLNDVAKAKEQSEQAIANAIRR